jgi:hypothetical protein
LIEEKAIEDGHKDESSGEDDETCPHSKSVLQRLKKKEKKMTHPGTRSSDMIES